MALTITNLSKTYPSPSERLPAAVTSNKKTPD